MHSLQHHSNQADPTAPIPADIQSLIDQAPAPVRKKFKTTRAALVAIDAAPRGKKHVAARVYGGRLGVSVATIYAKRCSFRKHGFLALLDKSCSSQFWQGHRDGLPAATVEYLKWLASDSKLTAQAAARALTAQLGRWRTGDASAAIPGYDTPPVGTPPPGWSLRNLARQLAPRQTIPEPGPLSFKAELSARLQGRDFVVTVRQTLPKADAKSMSWIVKGPRR